MRGRLFGLLMAAAVTFPASATAAPVLVMGRDGHVHAANDRFLPARASTPGPKRSRTPRASRATTKRAGAVAARARPRRRPKPPSVPVVLGRLLTAGEVSSGDYSRYAASWAAAVAAAKRLRGTRALELGAVMANLQAMAAGGALIPSRLPALFLTLDRNRQWWTTGPIPISGQEIEFSGSNLVWEYYPGQGLELQVLATFGRADGLYTAGPSQYSQMRALLDEMIPLAAARAGGLVWEYYFKFDGGNPPWASAMAQSTGLEALTRAAEAFGRLAGPSGSSSTYLQIAQDALPVFTAPPPAGVAVATPAGARYLQYSFTPGTDIINAFLQSLIGLYDYARFSGNQLAQQLFAAGNAQALSEVARFDTGAWSLYQPGVEDSLDYHELVTGFLDQLCSRTAAPAYCSTAQHFRLYMKIPPVLQLLTVQAPPKKIFRVRFSLSKYSHVGIVVTRGPQTALATSAYFGHGVRTFTLPSLKPGSYQVVLAATDLPGNFNRITATLTVSPPRR